MAIIILAIGAVLSAIGLYAIVTGYPAIEIERGWASVIAGSVLLSGGFVVIGLGLVLRALGRLQVTLPMAVATPAVVHAREPSFAPIAPAPPEGPFGAAVPVLAVAAPVAAAALAPGYIAQHEPAAASAPLEPEAPPAAFEDAHDTHRPTPGTPEPELPVESWDDRTLSALDHEADQPAHAPHAEVLPEEVLPEEHPEAHAPPPEDEPADAIVPEAVMPSLHELEPPPHVAAMDEPEPPPLAENAPEHEHEPEYAEADMHEAVAEAPATAPETPPADLAVIGRYDSEGTSYVMYSDGSIEAQSEAGIYRFSSMAELKAFIEG